MTSIQTIVVEPGTPELAICARWRATAFSVLKASFEEELTSLELFASDQPGEPMIWQWRYYQSAQLCLRCDRRKHEDESDRLAGLDQRLCETCARPMYFDGFSPYHSRRPLTCSYQCGYRRKIKHQLERKRVEHATVACVVCGEVFTQRR